MSCEAVLFKCFIKSISSQRYFLLGHYKDDAIDAFGLLNSFCNLSLCTTSFDTEEESFCGQFERAELQGTLMKSSKGPNPFTGSTSSYQKLDCMCLRYCFF